MSEEQLSWVPSDIDLTRPNAARIYDYVLGGANNFGVDREFAKKLLVTLPDIPAQAHQNRGFLRRTVAFMAEQGIRQFLDLGSGIPTVGNTHEVAQRIAPGAKVLYVDNEAVAVAHSELILQDNPDADILRADITDADSVLDSSRAQQLFDFDQPIGLLAFAIFHFVPDSADPAGLIARYRDATVSGSYLAMTHATADSRPEMTELAARYDQTPNPVTNRTKAQVQRLFTGYELVEPGLVFAPAWRPEVPVTDDGAVLYGAVGRKP